MLFVIDENSMGRLSCVLKCAINQNIHELTDISELGYSGFTDPRIFEKLASYKETVLITRDRRMLNTHYKDLKKWGHKVLILKIPSISKKNSRINSWWEICGEMVSSWPNIQKKFEYYQEQVVLEIDLKKRNHSCKLRKIDY